MEILTFENFERTINTLRDNIDRLNKIAEALNYANIFELSPSGQVIDLLAYIFDDKNGCINYWVYERNFGRDWYEGCVRDTDGSNINLSTTRKLYDFLVENMSFKVDLHLSTLTT